MLKFNSRGKPEKNLLNLRYRYRAVWQSMGSAVKGLSTGSEHASGNWP